MKCAEPGRERIPLRVRRGDVRCEHRELGRRIADRGARREPADQRERVSLPVVRIGERKGDEQVDTRAGGEDRTEVEGGRQHADDRLRCLVERDAPAHDRRVGRELALPERVAQHDHMRSVLGALLLRERAAEQWLHAEHREEILSDRDAGQADGVAVANQTRIADSVERVVSRNIREGPILLMQRGQVIHLHRLSGQASMCAVRDPDEIVRLAERQRAHEQRVGDAEDRRAGAYADGDDGDGTDGEGSLLAKCAQRIPHIVHEIAHQAARARGALAPGRGALEHLARSVEWQPEPPQRLAPRFGLRHPAPHELVHARIQKGAQLLVGIRRDAFGRMQRSTKQSSHAGAHATVGRSEIFSHLRTSWSGRP